MLMWRTVKNNREQLLKYVVTVKFFQVKIPDQLVTVKSQKSA